MRYYTLIARNHLNEPWAPQFGDFDKECVEDEEEDYKASETFKYTRIIKTGVKQADIDAAIQRINAKDVK